MIFSIISVDITIKYVIVFLFHSPYDIFFTGTQTLQRRCYSLHMFNFPKILWYLPLTRPHLIMDIIPFQYQKLFKQNSYGFRLFNSLFPLIHVFEFQLPVQQLISTNYYTLTVPELTIKPNRYLHNTCFHRSQRSESITNCLYRSNFQNPYKRFPKKLL